MMNNTDEKGREMSLGPNLDERYRGARARDVSEPKPSRMVLRGESGICI